MEDNKFKLSDTDFKAILLGDSNYINNKGANLYKEDTFKESVEYYRLAAAMGDIHSVSNLGYCYLYGRYIESNIDLALAYFNIASRNGDVDATYKLGDIYGSDKWDHKDKEMSNYYYRMAASFITKDEWNIYNVLYNDEFNRYPSLCFALGREMSIDGSMCTDLEISYYFLLKAKEGYENAIANGDEFYKDTYNNVLKYLDRECYDDIKKDMESEENDE